MKVIRIDFGKKKKLADEDNETAIESPLKENPSNEQLSSAITTHQDVAHAAVENVSQNDHGKPKQSLDEKRDWIRKNCKRKSQAAYDNAIRDFGDMPVARLAIVLRLSTTDMMEKEPDLYIALMDHMEQKALEEVIEKALPDLDKGRLALLFENLHLIKNLTFHEATKSAYEQGVEQIRDAGLEELAEIIIATNHINIKLKPGYFGAARDIFLALARKTSKEKTQAK